MAVGAADDGRARRARNVRTLRSATAAVLTAYFLRLFLRPGRTKFSTRLTNGSDYLAVKTHIQLNAGNELGVGTICKKVVAMWEGRLRMFEINQVIRFETPATIVSCCGM